MAVAAVVTVVTRVAIVVLAVPRTVCPRSAPCLVVESVARVGVVFTEA